MPIALCDETLHPTGFGDAEVVSAYEVGCKVVFCCVRAPMAIGCGSFHAVGLWCSVRSSIYLWGSHDGELKIGNGVRAVLAPIWRRCG